MAEYRTWSKSSSAKSTVFTGTIVKDGSDFVLRASSGDVYRLDAPSKAQSFEGKSVKVTGRLEEQAKLIHVDDIVEMSAWAMRRSEVLQSGRRVASRFSFMPRELSWTIHGQFGSVKENLSLRESGGSVTAYSHCTKTSSALKRDLRDPQIERGAGVRNVDEMISKALTRRNFLAGAGSAAALAAAGCQNHFQPQTVPTNPTPALTDADYLNFALNLEYLEASFYLIAATGTGLSAADAGAGAGTVTGGAQVPFTSKIQQEYAYEIAQDELNHVRFLRSALGSAAVSAPAIDLVNSFNGAASAAGIGASFNPFASFDAFLVGAFVFEDVGVTAYHGAAGLLTSTANLGAAAGIMAVEAYHAAEIRTLILQAGSTYVTYANQISKLRATLGGGNETTLSATSVVACDSTNAIAFARTTSEVLQIVYATQDGNVSSGGFFPDGLNGNIKSTTP